MFLRYAGPFFFLAAIPPLARYGVAAPLIVPGILIAALLIGEMLPGAQVAPRHARHALAHRLLPWLYIPGQIGVIAWGATVSAELSRSLSSVAILGLTIGTCCGIFGLLAAHEMVHSRGRAERILGQIMLAAMAYRHFRIAHIFGHHRFSGTPLDAATARKGESAYAFLPRSIWGQLVFASDFENRRLAGRRHAFFAHRLCQDAIMQLLLYAALLAVAPRAALFLAIQSAVAILVLEMFNYVAHYGLERRIGADGRLERMAAQHSWNSKGALANALIFNMGRHSDHHARPADAYQTLDPIPAPELPGGYAGAILLALLPPLWRRVMYPKIERWTGDNARSGRGGTSSGLTRVSVPKSRLLPAHPWGSSMQGDPKGIENCARLQSKNAS